LSDNASAVALGNPFESSVTVVGVGGGEGEQSINVPLDFVVISGGVVFEFDVFSS
jgi:hypothetical protein